MALVSIYQLMNQMRKNGKSIIMISEELMELIGMCDRILVFHEGRIVGELKREEFSEEAIMHLATATGAERAQ